MLLRGLRFPLVGALQQPNEVGDAQRLAAAGRIDAGGQQPAGRLVARSRPLGERVARGLASLRERDVDELEDLLAELRRRWATGDVSYRSMRTSPEYTRGIGQNTVGDTMP